MAKVLGGITTSHIPAVGNAIQKELYDDPYWKPFFDGYPKVHEWIKANKPDYVINIYNDHGLGFFLNQMPTFAIGAAHEYKNEDEGWGLPELPPAMPRPIGHDEICFGSALRAADSDHLDLDVFEIECDELGPAR